MVLPLAGPRVHRLESGGGARVGRAAGEPPSACRLDRSAGAAVAELERRGLVRLGVPTQGFCAPAHEQHVLAHAQGAGVAVPAIEGSVQRAPRRARWVQGRAGGHRHHRPVVGGRASPGEELVAGADQHRVGDLAGRQAGVGQARPPRLERLAALVGRADVHLGRVLVAAEERARQQQDAEEGHRGDDGRAAGSAVASDLLLGAGPPRSGAGLDEQRLEPVVEQIRHGRPPPGRCAGSSGRRAAGTSRSPR
ncbi:hypothetical protein B7486_52355 [cyanobacterium TDX16]|nr:hypothetical protein B7486_52355 [cyanobacterium TDX16]